MKEKMQEIGFQIIAQVGTAKSMYIESINLAKQGRYEEVDAMFLQADEMFNGAHKLHFELIQNESEGKDLPFSLLFMHAEDQLISTETIKIFAQEIIELRKDING